MFSQKHRLYFLLFFFKRRKCKYFRYDFRYGYQKPRIVNANAEAITYKIIRLSVTESLISLILIILALFELEFILKSI